jgi:SEC-C motif
MFAGYRTDDELRSPAAEMLQILRVAGCDTTNKRDLQRGVVAYNAALLVCKYPARAASIYPARKSRTGRNEPCPCGSGRKYKKCCLDSGRTLSADNDRSASLKFGPEILPRLWDEDAIIEDCALVSQIIDRDEAFANVGFSPEKIAFFMGTVFEQESSFVDDANQNDTESREQAIDDLAIRYLRESGERKVTRGIKDKFLAAATRARSKDEARALATGICLALMAEASRDPADDLLSIILFRKALFAAAKPIRIVDKVLGQLGGDKDELRRLIEANDPSIKEKIKSAVEELSASELDAMHASFDRRHNNLWDAIVADEFPVPMPFATQLSLMGRFASAASDENCSPDDLSAVLRAFSNELIEDDYVLYGQMLDRWLKNRQRGSDRIVDAVRMMRELCAIRSIEDLAPSLLIFCLQNRLLIPFEEEERNFIDDNPGANEKQQFILRYSSWLRTKGYAGMAIRLLLSWEIDGMSAEELPLRKSSIG